MNNKSISVILNSFKRQNYLQKQIDSVKKQSVPIKNIFIWNNGKYISPYQFTDDIVILNSSTNLGVWARFSFALNSDTEYICMLDDDTIPGELFFINCIETINKFPALLGTRGLRFLNAKFYEPYLSFGWDNPNERIEIVDIVGHAWFFKREWLNYFWREMPLSNSSKIVGEDMHFSYMLQKYAGIYTAVPPHPKNDKRLWGSNPDFAMKLGTDQSSISQGKEALKKFDKALRFYTKRGFLLCKDNDKVISEDFYLAPRLLRNNFLKKILFKIPFIKKYLKKIKNYLFNKNITF